MFGLFAGCIFVSAELKEAVRTWPHTDPVSWAQRTTAVALLNRLDQSLDKAVAALKLNDPKYYSGEKANNWSCNIDTIHFLKQPNIFF